MHEICGKTSIITLNSTTYLDLTYSFNIDQNLKLHKKLLIHSYSIVQNNYSKDLSY